jgi:hypothetical protein
MTLVRAELNFEREVDIQWGGHSRQKEELKEWQE